MSQSDWPLQAVWSKSVVVRRNRILKIFEKFIYWWPKRFADFWANSMYMMVVWTIGFIFFELIILGKLRNFFGRSFGILRTADPFDQDLCGFEQGQSSVFNLYIVLKRFLCKLCSWWLIHVKHRQSWHGPSLANCLIRHTTIYQSHFDIYNGSRGGDFECWGHETDNNGRIIENWTFIWL